MRVKVYPIAGRTAAAASVAAAQLPTAATPLTIVGGAPFVFGTQITLNNTNFTQPSGSPSELSITTLAGSPPGQVFTIVGYDRWGIALITEPVTNAAGGAAVLQSKCVYSRILSVTPSITDGANNVSVGTPQRVTSPWVQQNSTRGFDQVSIGYVGADNLVGAPTSIIELTNTSINEQGVFIGDNAGVGLNIGNESLPTYFGDNAPVDGTIATPTYPQQVVGASWFRVVVTSATGTSLIARFIRAGY